jgi:hypothetical protein
MAISPPKPETLKRPDPAQKPASTGPEADRPAPIRFSDWASI